MSKNHLKWFYRSLWLFATLGALLAFQNCAQVEFGEVVGSSNDPFGNDPYGTGGEGSSGNDPYGGANITRREMLDVSSTTTNNKIQLLLVIDDSYSMSDSKERLAKQANFLVDSLKGKDIEVGVTTVWYAGLSGSSTIKYYDSNGNLLSSGSSYLDLEPYAGKTIKQVTEYSPPALVPVGSYNGVNILGEVMKAYGYPDCTLSTNRYNSRCTNTSDATLQFIKSLQNKTVFSFSNLNTTQREILASALRITVEKIPLKKPTQDCQTQADGSKKCESYERGLCVVSSYLSDTSSTAFIKPSSLIADGTGKLVETPNKVGVVIISDEDDYSGQQNEKCNHAREITYKVGTEKQRRYYGKFKSIIPLGGDATLANRALRYTVDHCERTVTTNQDVYCDGKYCGTQPVTKTETSYQLPCSSGWETKSTPLDLIFKVLTGGTKYGDSCTDAERTMGEGQIPSYQDSRNPKVIGCTIPYPSWYVTFNVSGGYEYPLNFPSNINGNNIDLCTTSFKVDGVTYQNLMDYTLRYTFGNPSYLTTVENSCRYVDTEYQVDNVSTNILDIIPKEQNFGQALANISKNRFNGGVYITSIVNVDNSCSPVGSQSIGTQFINLSKYMGSNARTSSICSNSYTDSLASLVTQVTTVQKQFKLNLSNKEKVVAVTIVVGTRNIKVPFTDFSYSKGYLTVNSNELVAGSKIEVSIGE